MSDLCSHDELEERYRKQNVLLTFLNRLIEFDVKQVFLRPVDPKEVEFYADVIKHPMDLSTMRNKVEQFSYNNWFEFEKDFKLMINNCYTFNGPKSYYTNAGKRLENYYKKTHAKYKKLYNTPKRHKHGLSVDGVHSSAEENKKSFKDGKKSISIKNSKAETKIGHHVLLKRNSELSNENMHFFYIKQEEGMLKDATKPILNTFGNENDRKNFAYNEILSTFAQQGVENNNQRNANNKIEILRKQCKIDNNNINMNIEMYMNNIQMAEMGNANNENISVKRDKILDSLRKDKIMENYPKYSMPEKDKHINEICTCASGNTNCNVHNILNAGFEANMYMEQMCMNKIAKQGIETNPRVDMSKYQCNEQNINNKMYAYGNDKECGKNNVVNNYQLRRNQNSIINNTINANISGNINYNKDFNNFRNLQNYANGDINNFHVNNSNELPFFLMNTGNCHIRNISMQNENISQNYPPNYHFANMGGNKYNYNTTLHENVINPGLINTIDNTNLHTTLSIFNRNNGQQQNNLNLCSRALSDERNAYPTAAHNNVNLNISRNHSLPNQIVKFGMQGTPLIDYVSSGNVKMGYDQTTVPYDALKNLQLRNMNNFSNGKNTDLIFLKGIDQRDGQILINPNEIDMQKMKTEEKSYKQSATSMQSDTHISNIMTKQLPIINTDYNSSIKKIIGESNLSTVSQIFPQINDIFNKTPNYNLSHSFGDVKMLITNTNCFPENHKNMNFNEAHCNNFQQQKMNANCPLYMQPINFSSLQQTAYNKYRNNNVLSGASVECGVTKDTHTNDTKNAYVEGDSPVNFVNP